MTFTEHVKIREEKFGTVVFETLKEKVFVTNETGGQILNLLKEGRSPEEIIDIIKEDYDVLPETVEQEVKEFINSLSANNILAS